MSGALDPDGIGVVHLPSSVGTMASPPNVACYVTADAAQGAYSIIGSDFILDGEMLQFFEGCFLGAHDDHVDVVLLSGPSWSFIVVATPSF